MMSRNCFMYRQRFHFPFWPARQIISVRVKHSSPAGLRRARKIISSSLKLLIVCRNWKDAVRESRKFTKEAGKLQIYLFSDNPIPVKQGCRILVKESGICAEKSCKRFEVPIEAGCANERVH